METRNRKHMNTTISKESFKMIEEVTKETRIPKSKLLDEAIEYLYKKYIENKEK